MSMTLADYDRPMGLGLADTPWQQACAALIALYAKLWTANLGHFCEPRTRGGIESRFTPPSVSLRQPRHPITVNDCIQKVDSFIDRVLN